MVRPTISVANNPDKMGRKSKKNPPIIPFPPHRIKELGPLVSSLLMTKNVANEVVTPKSIS